MNAHELAEHLSKHPSLEVSFDGAKLHVEFTGDVSLGDCTAKTSMRVKKGATFSEEDADKFRDSLVEKFTEEMEGLFGGL